jgi:hypothetical protein
MKEFDNDIIAQQILEAISHQSIVEAQLNDLLKDLSVALSGIVKIAEMQEALQAIRVNINTIQSSLSTQISEPATTGTPQTDLPPDYANWSLGDKIEFIVAQETAGITASDLQRKLLALEPSMAKSTDAVRRKFVLNLYASLNYKTKTGDVKREMVNNEFVYKPVDEQQTKAALKKVV